MKILIRRRISTWENGYLNHDVIFLIRRRISTWENGYLNHDVIFLVRRRISTWENGCLNHDVIFLIRRRISTWENGYLNHDVIFLVRRRISTWENGYLNHDVIFLVRRRISTSENGYVFKSSSANCWEVVLHCTAVRQCSRCCTSMYLQIKTCGQWFKIHDRPLLYIRQISGWATAWKFSTVAAVTAGIGNMFHRDMHLG